MQAETALPCDAGSAGAARRFVTSRLAAVGLGELADTAELLVSELVTNAVLHAHTSVIVTVEATGPRSARVTVRDGSRLAPAPRRHSVSSGTGRGLLLVQQLAAGWGAEVEDSGKAVWFDVAAIGDGREPGVALFDDFDEGLDEGLAAASA